MINSKIKSKCYIKLVCCLHVDLLDRLDGSLKWQCAFSINIYFLSAVHERNLVLLIFYRYLCLKILNATDGHKGKIGSF